MADDHNGGGDGGRSSNQPTPAANSSELHAQAVRFLTSIRHHSPDASIASQREFLQSKGLDETAIDAALRDAERPPIGNAIAGSPTPPSSSSSSSSESQAFDQAARAFDDPINQPAPELPARTYPRSPLALYYDERGGAGGDPNDANAALPLTRRYAVVLQFFKTLSWMLTFGGAFTGVAVLLYRAFVLPKITATLDARSVLLKYHHELWDKVVERVSTLRDGRIAPTIEASEALATNAAISDAAATSTAVVKRVQFADEVKGAGKLEMREGEDAVRKSNKEQKASGTVAALKKANGSGAEEKEKVKGDGDGDRADGSEGQDANADGSQEDDTDAAADAARLPPIDLSGPLRTSLSALTSALRGGSEASASTSANGATTATTVTAADSVAKKSPTVSDEDSDESSDSWQDTSNDEADGDDEDDVEFDPFASATTSKKNKKRDTKTKRRPAQSAISSQRTRTSSSSSSSSNPHWSDINTSSEASSSLYASLTSLASSITSRHLYNQTRSSGLVGNKSMSSFAWNSSAPADKGNNAGGANDEVSDSSLELAAQIRAEIRSLKGLLLSRRNFPRHAVVTNTNGR